MSENGLTLDEYQAATRRTAGHFESHTEALKCWAMGVAGESGEFVDRVKKWAYHGHDPDPGALRGELGDILWYVARAAEELGFSLSSVALSNIEKLRARYPEGFSSERSRNRESEPGEGSD